MLHENSAYENIKLLSIFQHKIVLELFLG